MCRRGEGCIAKRLKRERLLGGKHSDKRGKELKFIQHKYVKDNTIKKYEKQHS